MRLKWYIEFPFILLLICAAVFFVLNVNFPSCNNTAPADQYAMDTSAVTSKLPPEKEKWIAGRKLFQNHCAACHYATADGEGPALLGVTKRWEEAGSYKGKTGKQWLYAWIKNWHDPVAAGYKYAIAMKKSRVAEMNVYGNMLTDGDIDKILFCVENPDLLKGTRVGDAMY